MGKQVTVKDKNSGAVVETGNVTQVGTEQNPDNTKDITVELNNDPSDMKSTEDYTIETTSVLQELMSIKFDENDYEDDNNKKTAGTNDFDLDINLDESNIVTAESESVDSSISFEDDNDTESTPDRSKGETKPFHKKKKGGLGTVNPHADRTKLNREAIGDDFFED